MMIKMSTKGFTFNKGFTLLEVIIAMSIISIVMSASLSSFSNRSKELNLQEAYNAAKDSLRTAQNKAQAEVGSPGAGADQKYKYAGVRFVKDSGEYISFRSSDLSDSVCGTLDATKTVQDSVSTLPYSMVAKMDSTETPTCIFFEYPTGNTYVSKGSFGVNPCSN